MAESPFRDIKVCVFDAYGTLFDFNSAPERCRDALGDKTDELSALWRNKQLQYTWLRGLMGRHKPFREVTGDALDFALEHTRPGGLILGDNTDCFGQGNEELAPDHPAYGIQAFNQRIATDKRLQSMIIPVGSWLSVSRVLENPE